MSIKKTLKRFDEQFVNEYGHLKDVWATNDIKQFITEEIKLATEEMLKSKTFPELESDDFDKGYAKAVEDFKSNFNKYFE